MALLVSIGSVNWSSQSMLTRRRFVAGTACLGTLSVLGCGSLVHTASEDGVQDTEALAHTEDLAAKSRFLRLCDVACQELNKPITPFLWTYVTNSGNPKAHHMPFFEDAHAVRALCVAYDMTGDIKYLDTCQRWTDRVIAFQNQMTPDSAYYMNYGREPDADRGNWYVADSGTIGMGVLATSIRALDVTDKLRYLNSVRAFAELVTKNYVGKNGGIANGLWGGYHEEWWASTATAGALLFLLDAEVASGEYSEVALQAFDWMLLHGLRKAVYPSFEQKPAAVVFYYGQFYAIALHHSALQGSRREAANVPITEMLEWLSKNQKGRGAINYFVSTYMAGMPYLMTAFAGELPQAPPALRSAADEELRYIDAILFKDGVPDATQLSTWELMSWAMMSYAEKLSPSALFRNSQDADAIPKTPPEHRL
jgi:hypothetical protein